MWQSDSTTTGEADCQLQSILKFRSSLFKGLAGCGAAAPINRLAECEAEPHESISFVCVVIKVILDDDDRGTLITATGGKVTQ